MKRRNIIIIIVAVLIAITIGAFIIYHINQENGKSYEIEQVKQYNYFLLKQGEQYGVIDRKGNIIIDAKYSEIKIPNPEKAVFACYQGEDVKILNEKKEEILSQYSNVEPIRLKNIVSDLMYEKSVLKYKKDEKYGLISFDGKEITKPIYDEIDSLPYKEGELLVKQNEKYGVINIKGNKIVEIIYDKIAVDEFYTDENRYKYAGYIVSITTQEGYRYGYLNFKGEEILKPEYNELTRVTEIQENENAYLLCAKNGRYGIMKNQETIIGNEYQSIRYDATNQVFVVEKSKKHGIANKDGKLIVPVQYSQIDITGIYFYAQNEQGTTVYDNKGSETNMVASMAILNTSNDKYKIRIDNENGTKYGVISKEEKQLIDSKYNYIEYLYDNYFIVSNEEGKLGILDDKENVKVEINKASIQKIQNTNLVQATLDNKTIQLYNKNMELICEMQNAMIEEKNNNVRIQNEMETRYFNKEGKEVKNTEVYPNNKLFVKVENGKYGYVDNNGNTVVDYKYDKAYEFNEYGYASIKKDGKWSAINEQGIEVAPISYQMNDQSEPFFIGSYYRVTYGFGEIYYTNTANI